MNNFILSLFLTLTGLAIITILHTRLFLNIDFENWEIQKCNPKYIFYSGYIKQNPNLSKLQTTTDNFKECVVKFNNTKDSQFSNLLEKNASEHLEKTGNMVNSNNEISAQRALELQKKIQMKKNEFQLQLENIEDMNTMDELQKEINKLSDIIYDMQEYAHSYLTYAMTHFLFKYKIAEENDTLGNNLNSDVSCSVHNGTGNEDVCNSNLYCNYDLSNNLCNNITKGEFYKQEAINLNNTIGQYFGNNKL